MGEEDRLYGMTSDSTIEIEAADPTYAVKVGSRLRAIRNQQGLPAAQLADQRPETIERAVAEDDTSGEVEVERGRRQFTIRNWKFTSAVNCKLEIVNCPAAVSRMKALLAAVEKVVLTELTQSVLKTL